MKSKYLLVSSLLAILSTFSCNTKKATSIELDKSYLNLAMGDSFTLNAKVDTNKNNVRWSSLDSNIAKVDEKTGLITPISSGKTKITAKIDDISATCDVSIRMKTIILGIDGAGDFFSQSTTPNIFNIFINNPLHNSVTTKTHGCLTSNPTISAQCWGSMLCGVAPEIHKFKNDSIEVNPNTSHPSIFYEANRQLNNPELASFVNWYPINTGIVENNINVNKYTRTDDGVLTQAICTYLTNNEPDLLYVQFDSVDHAGHEYDYGSKEYNNQLRVVDGYVDDIYKVLKTRNLLDKYNFIVTADHGGINKDHGGLSDKEKYIFFGISGDNIQKHEDDKRLIEDMNVIDITAILAHCLCIENNSEWGEGIQGGIKIPSNIFIR